MPSTDAIFMTCRDCARENIRVVGRGLCGACYDRHWNNGTLGQFPRLSRQPKPIPAEKPCAICKAVLPLDAFGKNNRRSDGRGSYCKPCARTKYHIPARARQRAVERPAEGDRTCRDCGETKSVDDFYWETDKGRFRYECKACMGVKGKRYWERAGGSHQRRANLKYKYGLTEACYQELLEKQGGVCAICRRPPEGLGRKLAVDHCHSTGKVRGLLCSACNCGIGMLGDDRARVLAAAEYLKNGIENT